MLTEMQSLAFLTQPFPFTMQEQEIYILVWKSFKAILCIFCFAIIVISCQ